MDKELQTLNYVVFLIYFVILAGVGYRIYLRKKNPEANVSNFFSRENTMIYWVIGVCLVVSSIKIEQFTGMSGSGFALGLAFNSYVWVATLLLIAGVRFVQRY